MSSPGRPSTPPEPPEWSLAAVTAPLPPLPVQYVEYAAWQREVLPPLLGPHREYWRAALREGALPPLELPLDFPRPAVQTFRGDTVPVALPADLVQRLEEVCRAQGCTLFQLVLALWALLLCRHERIRDSRFS